MKKGLASFLLVVILSFGFAKNCFAAFSFNITSIDPTSVTSKDQEVTVNVSITDLPSASYFRAEWQKSSGATYFGYSKDNTGNWTPVNSTQDCKTYFSVTDTNTTSLVLSTKIGTDNNPDNSDYTLRVRRYTSTCSSTSDTDPVTISINLPTPTPSPTPSPSPTSTPTPAPTHTATPTSTPVKTATPSLKPTTTPQVEGASDPTMSSTPAATLTPEVLADATSAPDDSPATPTNKFPIVAIIFLILGIGMVGVAVAPTAIKKYKDYKNANNN